MNTNDFIVKKQGKREYLNTRKITDLMKKFEILFESSIEVPRIKIGKRQTIATLIDEPEYVRHFNKIHVNCEETGK